MTEVEWWQEAFQSEYLSIYAHRDDASAQAEAAGVSQLCNPSAKILDACCGNGRHAAALIDLGFDVQAFDYSLDLLAVAAERQQLQGRLFQADVRSLPVAQQFDLLTLFFTAFGYFDDDSNQDVFSGLINALRPNGLLMLDLPNPQQVRDSLVPHSKKQTDAGLEIFEDRRIEGHYVAKDVHIFAEGEVKRSYTERVRLYERHELENMASTNNVVLEDCWPSLLGPNEDQNRHVYWFRK